MTHAQAFWAVVVIAAVTAGLRFLPFAVFARHKTPKVVAWLGRVLPCAVMAMLVVYCLRDVRFGSAEAYLPALLASVSVVGLHVWKRNTLLSIVGGTVLYMVLIRVM